MPVGFNNSTALPQRVLNGTAAFDRVYARLFNPEDPANAFANDEIYRPGLTAQLQSGGGGGLVTSPLSSTPGISSVSPVASAASTLTLSPLLLIGLVVLLLLIF